MQAKFFNAQSHEIATNTARGSSHVAKVLPKNTQELAASSPNTSVTGHREYAHRRSATRLMAEQMPAILAGGTAFWLGARWTAGAPTGQQGGRVAAAELVAAGLAMGSAWLMVSAAGGPKGARPPQSPRAGESAAIAASFFGSLGIGKALLCDTGCLGRQLVVDASPAAVLATFMLQAGRALTAKAGRGRPAHYRADLAMVAVSLVAAMSYLVARCDKAARPNGAFFWQQPSADMGFTGGLFGLAADCLCPALIAIAIGRGASRAGSQRRASQGHAQVPAAYLGMAFAGTALGVIAAPIVLIRALSGGTCSNS